MDKRLPNGAAPFKVPSMQESGLERPLATEGALFWTGLKWRALKQITSAAKFHRHPAIGCQVRAFS